MDKVLNISEEYLKEAIDSCFNSLVGEQCKRFEILTDLPQIKKDCKELVHEKKRELIAILNAFDKGVKFITPKTQK